MVAPQAGKHYPRSLGEFQAWFPTDADCLDYLEWLRWPGGFVCPGCAHPGGWRLGDGRLECVACASRSSPTAGTIFDRTRTSLTVWFTACWLFASQKSGISALSLKRLLEIGSYQTAWAMLHRLRSVLVRPGRERLTGEVEVDESYFGGEEPGLRGGRQKGKKVLVGIAVERTQPKGFGRCRMAPLLDASADSLRAFLTDNVEPGARVITDGWRSYPPATAGLYVHEPLAGPRGRMRPSCSPGCTRSPRWPSDGCWAPTRDRLTLPTCRATSTSSCSASTGADRAAAASSSTACSSSRPTTTRCATETSSPTRGPAASGARRRAPEAARPACSDRQRAGPGERASSG